jgi:acyl-coenzyme A thioesterase PaaI-like protein
MKELPHTRSCFVCGEANPLGLNLRFETDGQVVCTRFEPRDEHAGFRQTVHGGLIATVLDEAMVWACAVRTKRFGFCAELNVRFLQTLKPRQSITVVAELSADRRRLFEAKAELRQDSQVLARATGKYVPVEKAQLSEMASDFVGSWQWMLEAGDAAWPTSPRY